ncbi:MAG: DNA repair protein RecO [Thermoanaerobaculum sp.]
MPLITEEAIVLARYPFKEKSAVVVFLSRGKGIIRAVARAARGRSGGGVALEPLAKVKATLFVSPRRELATVNEVVLERSALDLAARPQAWAASLVAAELALELCPPGTSQEAFFRLLEKTLLWLEGGADPELAMAYVLMWSLKLAGVLPDVATCAAGGEALENSEVVLVRDVGFCCPAHSTSGVTLSAHSQRFLRQALKKPLDQMTAKPGPELIPTLVTLLERFLEKPLRSLSVFRQLGGPGASAC